MDILKRLRDSSPNEGSHDLQCRCLDAADEIERLRSVIDSAADLVDYDIGAGEEARMIREWKEPNASFTGSDAAG